MQQYFVQGGDVESNKKNDRCVFYSEHNGCPYILDCLILNINS